MKIIMNLRELLIQEKMEMQESRYKYFMRKDDCSGTSRPFCALRIKLQGSQHWEHFLTHLSSETESAVHWNGFASL